MHLPNSVTQTKLTTKLYFLATPFNEYIFISKTTYVNTIKEAEKVIKRSHLTLCGV